MAAGPYPFIARQGWLPVAVIAALAVAVGHRFGLVPSVPLWLVAGLVLALFRDPEREVPSLPLAVVSPVDGTVTAVDAVRDPYLERDAVRVAMDMARYGVYSTRSPVEGKVREARADGRHGVWLQTDEGDDVVVVMHRGPLRNAPQCHVQFGQRVGQGQRCGFIHLGGRVELYLPAGSRVEVRPGQRVRAGADVVAMLLHK